MTVQVWQHPFQNFQVDMDKIWPKFIKIPQNWLSSPKFWRKFLKQTPTQTLVRPTQRARIMKRREIRGQRADFVDRSPGYGIGFIT